MLLVSLEKSSEDKGGKALGQASTLRIFGFVTSVSPKHHSWGKQTKSRSPKIPPTANDDCSYCLDGNGTKNGYAFLAASGKLEAKKLHS